MRARRSQAALIVGSIGIDTVETPDARRENVLGGAASFASIAASYFAPVRMVGIAGGDFPKAFVDLYRRHGIDVAGLKIEEAEKTFRWSGRYREDFSGRDTVDVQLNAMKLFTAELPASYRDSRFVLLGAIQPSLQHRVIDQVAKGPGRFLIADTFDLWIHTVRPDLDRLLKRIDLLVINEEESHLLTGERNPLRASRALRRMGPRSVVIKQGPHGSALFHPDGYFAIPAYPVEKFADPTGAGDSYAGAMIGYLASVGRTDFAALRKAVAYATAVASLTVESFSVDRLSSGGRKTIDARYRTLAKIVRF